MGIEKSNSFDVTPPYHQAQKQVLPMLLSNHFT